VRWCLESERAIASMKTGQHNPIGEKGPHLMQAYPELWKSPFPLKGVRGTRTLEKLQGRLYQAAKASRKRRFYTLHDKICRMDVLREAWKHVAKNKGAPGIDEEEHHPSPKRRTGDGEAEPTHSRLEQLLQPQHSQ
jgi:hypothetical protein